MHFDSHCPVSGVQINNMTQLLASSMAEDKRIQPRKISWWDIYLWYIIHKSWKIYLITHRIRKRNREKAFRCRNVCFLFGVVMLMPIMSWYPYPGPWTCIFSGNAPIFIFDFDGRYGSLDFGFPGNSNRDSVIPDSVFCWWYTKQVKSNIK